MSTLSGFSSKNTGSLSQDIPSFFGSHSSSESASDPYHIPHTQPNGQYPGTSTSTHAADSVPNWQHTLPTSFNDIPMSSRPRAEVTLGELLVAYPIVQELHNNLNVAHHRISLALDTQAALIKDNMRLSDELHKAREGYRCVSPVATQFSFPSTSFTWTTSLAPSDSLSVAPPPPAQRTHQPATRPAQYPVEILWSLEDTKVDIDVGASETNMSRPAMANALRHIDGTDLSEGEYRAIRATAHSIAHELNQLPLPPGRPHLKGKNRTMRFYKQNMVQEWNQAVANAEAQQELLTLCSAHWKAEHVLQAALQAAHVSAKLKRSSNSDRRKKSTSPARSTASPTSGSKRPRADSITKRAKKKLHTGVAAPTDPAQVAASISLVVTSPPKVSDPGKSTLVTNKFVWTAAPTSSFLEVLASTNTGGSQIPDTSQVDGPQPTLVDPSSCQDLIDMISREHPHLPNLTDAVELLRAIDANPTFTDGSGPSSEFMEFLQRIETAIPSPTDDEDHTYQSWGHLQFTAGTLTCSSVLKNWACIGSPFFARRLIAAALTTCRMAHWICTTQMLTPMPSESLYVSSSYLNETCRLLWVCWKEAGGPFFKGKGRETPLSLPSSDSSASLLPSQTSVDHSASQIQHQDGITEELRKLLELWTVPQLKKWMADHQLIAPPGSRKAGLVSVICAATSTQKPSLDVAQSGIEKRGKKMLTSPTKHA